MTDSSRAAQDAAWEPSALEFERREYRRAASLRSAAVAFLSTAVFAALVAVGLSNSPGWDAVKHTFFNVPVAIEAFPAVLEGLWLNIRALFFATLGVAIFGTLIAVLRSLRGPVFFPIRFLAATYTDLVRGAPLLIVLYLVGFGIPALQIVPRMPAVFWGTLAIIITYSAYVAEVLRAGLDSVHPSQRIAARSLGLSHGQTLRLVVIPQGVRKVVPALMNDFVSMQKDVGLISVLGAVDAVRAAQIEVAHTYNFTPYVVAALLFIAISFPMIRLTDHVTARMTRREQNAGTV